MVQAIHDANLVFDFLLFFRLSAPDKLGGEDFSALVLFVLDLEHHAESAIRGIRGVNSNFREQ